LQLFLLIGEPPGYVVYAAHTPLARPFAGHLLNLHHSSGPSALHAEARPATFSTKLLETQHAREEAGRHLQAALPEQGRVQPANLLVFRHRAAIPVAEKT